MSVIKKKPMIEKIIEELADDGLDALVAAKNCLNDTQPETFKSLCDSEFGFTEDDSNPGSYQIELERGKIRNGVLINDYFLVYGDSQKITIYELDLTNKKYKLIEEFCDINELRRVLDINLINGGAVVISPESLVEVMEGSSGVIVDLNEDGDKVRVDLDQDVWNRLSQLPDTPDEEIAIIEWDSTANAYKARSDDYATLNNLIGSYIALITKDDDRNLNCQFGHIVGIDDDGVKIVLTPQRFYLNGDSAVFLRDIYIYDDASTEFADDEAGSITPTRDTFVFKVYLFRINNV